MNRLSAIVLIALAAGCEDAPPAVVDGSNLPYDAGADTREPGDLAQHVVVLPPPTAITITYQPLTAGAAAVVTWKLPNDPRVAGARVLRRNGTLPLGPFDPMAQLVYAGPGELASQRVRELVALEESLYAVFSCDANGGCEDAGIERPFAVTVAEALVDGGYAIYLQHGSATLCADELALGPAATTSDPNWWKSCDSVCATATAAQLDANGAGQTSLVGTALRARHFPVGRLVASEFCRTRAVAGALGLEVPVETNAGITYFVYDDAQRCANSLLLLELPSGDGTNTVIVGHGDFPGPCEPLSSLGAGEAALYRSATATEAGRFIETVFPGEWAAIP